LKYSRNDPLRPNGKITSETIMNDFAGDVPVGKSGSEVRKAGRRGWDVVSNSII
jgi:hypothetical protein